MNLNLDNDISTWSDAIWMIDRKEHFGMDANVSGVTIFFPNIDKLNLPANIVSHL